MQNFSGNNGQPLAKRFKNAAEFAAIDNDQHQEVVHLPEDIDEGNMDSGAENSILLPEPILPIRKGFIQDPSAPKMASDSDEDEDSDTEPVLQARKPFHQDPSGAQMAGYSDDEESDSDTESKASEFSDEDSEDLLVYRGFIQDPTAPVMF